MLGVHIHKLSLSFVWLQAVLGQTMHTVTVGDEGSFYDPPTVAAGLNDVINFVFTGLTLHGVTQTSLENPCLPLPGGFNSGLNSLSNSSDPNEAPVWQLIVTNISAPIWFFCEFTHPVSHCGAGMVGAINPPSQEQFNAFVVAAKNTSTTLTSTLPYAATGVGAFASQTPILSSVGLQFLTAGQPQSSTTPTSTPLSSPSSNGDHKSSDTGAIVGGAVGGSIGVGLLVLTGVYLCLRHRRRTRAAPSQMYHADISSGNTERWFSEQNVTKLADNVTPTFSVFHPPSSPSPSQQHHHTRMSTTPSVERRVYGQSQFSDHHNSTSFSVANPDDSSTGEGYTVGGQSHPSHVSSSLPLLSSLPPTSRERLVSNEDVNSLAQEVAAVLAQQRKSSSAMPGTKTRLDPPSHLNAPPDVTELDVGLDRSTTPPPGYRAS